MMTGWLRESTLPALEQVAIFAQRRHQVLAGNIANIDTPNYQTRDISLSEFRAELGKAISPSNKDTIYVPGQGNRPISQKEAMERVRDVSNQILLHDGSDVSLEQQVTEIAKNQSMHNTAIALMRSQMQTLQMAIRESASV